MQRAWSPPEGGDMVSIPGFPLPVNPGPGDSYHLGHILHTRSHHMTAMQISAASNSNEPAAQYMRGTSCCPYARTYSLAFELGLQMADLGHSDNRSGNTSLPFSCFEAAAKRILTGTGAADALSISTVAQLLQDNYMIGYNGQ